MKLMCERKVNTKEFAGTVDLIIAEKEPVSEVEFDELFHTYTKNDDILPSVTQLLDKDEYMYVAPEILDYANFKGTLVHKEIQDYLENGIAGFTEEAESFSELWEKEKDKLIKPCIVDYKTYSANPPKKREKCYKQCQMYAEAYKYLTGDEITQFYEIWLPHGKKAKIINLSKEFGKDLI